MNPIPATANIRSAVLLDHSLDPIATGTVTYYLQVISGSGGNDGKWYVSDNTWNAAETAYGAGSANGTQGAWTRSVRAEGWIEGSYYVEYWKDSLGRIANAPGGVVYCTDVVGTVTTLTGHTPQTADVADVKEVTDKLDTIIEVIV